MSRAYPFPYGFVLGTSAADGDCLDCYVLSTRPLASGDTVECTVLGLMEQWEDGVADHNVLACPLGERACVDDSVARVLTEFVAHVFDHLPGKRVRAGQFLDAAAALRHIADCRR